MIGQKLRLARAAAGLSLRDLDAKINKLVSAQAIGKYERDEDMPSSHVLRHWRMRSMCRRIICSPAMNGVGRGRVPQSGNYVQEGRGLRRGPDATFYGAVSWRWRACWAWPVWRNRDRPREAPYPIKELADVENAAARSAGSGLLGVDPIPNLSELLEEHGIKVLSIDLKDIDGLTARVKRKDHEPIPVIAVKCGAWSDASALRWRD